MLDKNHPFAAYSAVATMRALLFVLMAWLAGRSVPGVFWGDLVVLLAAYAATTGVLWLGRRFSRANVLATVMALALVVGTATAFGGYVLREHNLPLPSAGWHSAVAAVVLLLIILPQAGPRWLAWREGQALAALAAQHAAERTLLEARLAALQGQIEPHFLYNTLANVQYLLRRDATGADAMLSHLITYLRTTLPDMRQPEAPLRRELANVQAYLDIMQIRMGKRLSYELDCPGELDHALVPTLALATLVENALKHGLEPKLGGGRISVSARKVGDMLVLAVADDGAGFNEKGSGEGGVGLRNLRERLSVRFGAAAELQLEPGREGGVVASVRLPLVYNEEGE